MTEDDRIENELPYLIRPEGLQILCPTCGHHNTHVDAVYSVPGTDSMMPIRGTAFCVCGDRMRTERQTALVIRMEGECPHLFEVRIQEHKGEVWINLIPRGDRSLHIPREVTAPFCPQ